jgi:hypothetical protein
MNTVIILIILFMVGFIFGYLTGLGEDVWLLTSI